MDTSNLNTSVSKINKLNFVQAWNGSAYEAQSQRLIDTMNDLNKSISDVNDFNIIEEKRKKYEKICEEISRLYTEISRCKVDHSKENVSCSCSSNYSSIAKLEKERLALRSEIIDMLSKFEGIDPELLPPIDYSVESSEFKILFDWKYLRDFCISQGHPIYSGGLFKLYEEEGGAEYVLQRIRDVANQCRNEREIAVNVSLLYIQMAADKGVKLDYEHTGQGGLDYSKVNATATSLEYTFKEGNGVDTSIVFNKNYNNTFLIQRGTDCCGLVSYGLNIALSDDPTYVNPQAFKYRWVGGFNDFGEKTDVSNVKPGDVFIWGNSSNPSAHTGFILGVEENPDNPGTGKIAFIESGGPIGQHGVNEYLYTSNDNGTININGYGLISGQNITSVILRNYDEVYNREVDVK